MSTSKEEEIIAVLWVIAAFIAFGNGFTFWGVVFSTKAILDTACSIFYALKEIEKEKRERK